MQSPEQDGASRNAATFAICGETSKAVRESGLVAGALDQLPGIADEQRHESDSIIARNAAA